MFLQGEGQANDLPLDFSWIKRWIDHSSLDRLSIRVSAKGVGSALRRRGRTRGTGGKEGGERKGKEEAR